MKANELRIGNYVKLDDKFIEIDIDSFSTKNIMDLPLTDWVNPIPLTEEWLIKLGFKLKKQWEEITNPTTLKEEDIKFHKIKKYENEKCIAIYVIIELNYISVYVTPRHLTKHIYVHQLQNLYFALTGEELTIKE